MSLEQAILEAVRALPAEKQQEILSHAARLRADQRHIATQDDDSLIRI